MSSVQPSLHSELQDSQSYVMSPVLDGEGEGKGERERKRQTDRQAQRETDTETHRDTHRERERREREGGGLEGAGEELEGLLNG